MTQQEQRLRQALSAVVKENLTPEQEKCADVWGFLAGPLDGAESGFTDFFLEQAAQCGLDLTGNTGYNGIFLGITGASGLAKAEVHPIHPLDSLRWYRSHWDSDRLAANWQWLGAHEPDVTLKATANEMQARLLELETAMTAMPFGSQAELMQSQRGLPDNADEVDALLSRLDQGITEEEFSELVGHAPEAAGIFNGFNRPQNLVPDAIVMADGNGSERYVRWDGDGMPPLTAEIISRHGFILYKAADASPESTACYAARFIEYAPPLLFPLEWQAPVYSVSREAQTFKVYRKPMEWRSQSPAPGVYLLNAAVRMRSDLTDLAVDLDKAVPQTSEYQKLILRTD